MMRKDTCTGMSGYATGVNQFSLDVRLFLPGLLNFRNFVCGRVSMLLELNHDKLRIDKMFSIRPTSRV